MTLTPLQIDT